MKILVSGASGLVGTALCDALRAEGHSVGRFVRPGSAPAPGDVRWAPNSATVDMAAMEGADAVVHLNGASIADGRWTEARKIILRSSRVDSTRVLVDSLVRMKQKPRVLVSASAVGYYGNRGNEILTESSGYGSDFLSLLARAWEAEAMRAELSGIRTVILRFGVILSAQGGALSKMARPFRLGLGGRLGDGQQWMSWIALEDAIGVIRAALANSQWKGPVNVVAPQPVRNGEFTRVLASVLHRPAFLPAPAFMLRLMLGEMADALLLSSQRVVPEKLLAAGYKFRFDQLESALRAMLGSAHPK